MDDIEAIIQLGDFLVPLFLPRKSPFKPPGNSDRNQFQYYSMPC
jgi:hypothetical protein